jgi:hypothetical protein
MSIYYESGNVYIILINYFMIALNFTQRKLKSADRKNSLLKVIQLIVNRVGIHTQLSDFRLHFLFLKKFFY